MEELQRSPARFLAALCGDHRVGADHEAEKMLRFSYFGGLDRKARLFYGLNGTKDVKEMQADGSHGAHYKQKQRILVAFSTYDSVCCCMPSGLPRFGRLVGSRRPGCAWQTAGPSCHGRAICMTSRAMRTT